MTEIKSKSRGTVSNWYGLLSLQAFHIMKNIKPVKIGGIGHVIEVDESKFSKRKFNIVRLNRSRWVIGGVNINTGEVFFREVLFRNKETITSVVLECVEIGTKIITDFGKVTWGWTL